MHDDGRGSSGRDPGAKSVVKAKSRPAGPPPPVPRRGRRRLGQKDIVHLGHLHLSLRQFTTSTRLTSGYSVERCPQGQGNTKGRNGGIFGLAGQPTPMSDTLSAAASSQEPSESDMLYALSIAERRALQETTDQEATVERVPGTPAPTLPGESPPGPTRRSRRASHPPEVDEEVMAENRLGPQESIDYWRDVASVPTPVQGAGPGPLTIMPDTPVQAWRRAAQAESRDRSRGRDPRPRQDGAETGSDETAVYRIEVPVVGPATVSIHVWVTPRQSPNTRPDASQDA